MGNNQPWQLFEYCTKRLWFQTDANISVLFFFNSHFLAHKQKELHAPSL